MTDEEKAKALDLIFTKRVDIPLLRAAASHPGLGFDHYHRGSLWYGNDLEITKEDYEFLEKVAKYYEQNKIQR